MAATHQDVAIGDCLRLKNNLVTVNLNNFRFDVDVHSDRCGRDVRQFQPNSNSCLFS